MIIQLTVPGQPMGKQVARARNVNTKAGKSFIMHYTPKKTVNYMVFVKELFVIKYPNFKPWEGAISTNITAYLTIPKSKSNKQKELMRQGKILPIVKPDEDNIKKAIYDALEKLTFIDDKQVVRSSFAKYYSETPRVEIIVSEINLDK